MDASIKVRVINKDTVRLLIASNVDGEVVGVWRDLTPSEVVELAGKLHHAAFVAIDTKKGDAS